MISNNTRCWLLSCATGAYWAIVLTDPLWHVYIVQLEHTQYLFSLTLVTYTYTVQIKPTHQLYSMTSCDMCTAKAYSVVLLTDFWLHMYKLSLFSNCFHWPLMTCAHCTTGTYSVIVLTDPWWHLYKWRLLSNCTHWPLVTYIHFTAEAIQQLYSLTSYNMLTAEAYWVVVISDP